MRWQLILFGEIKMDKGNIPSSKQQADIFLSAYKLALLDLLASINNNTLTVADVSTHAWAEIEEIDSMLEGGEYE